MNWHWALFWLFIVLMVVCIAAIVVDERKQARWNKKDMEQRHWGYRVGDVHPNNRRYP